VGWRVEGCSWLGMGSVLSCGLLCFFGGEAELPFDL
jgi:hypothetical protein